MNRISREDVLDIANRINSLCQIEISETWKPDWPVYPADFTSDCWYLTFRSSPPETSVSTAVLLAISKANGGILYSGLIDQSAGNNKPQEPLMGSESQFPGQGPRPKTANSVGPLSESAR
jgi:hypothetical protein